MAEGDRSVICIFRYDKWQDTAHLAFIFSAVAICNTIQKRHWTLLNNDMNTVKMVEGDRKEIAQLVKT